MDEEVDKVRELVYERAVFVPGHLTRAMIAGAVAVGTGAISIVATKYALFELKRTSMAEIQAMIKGV